MANEREIDALLATHLFGLRSIRERGVGPGEPRLTALVTPVMGDPKHPHIATVPHYSTTGDGVLMVVEAMRARGLWLIVVRHQTGYEVAFYDPDGRKGQPNVNTSDHPGREWDLPWAAAAAALKTLGLEVPV